MNRLLVTGDSGLLGSAIAAQGLPQFNVFGLSRTPGFSMRWAHRSFDLLEEDVTSFLGEVQPSAIVHCAAATDVEHCEKDPASTDALNVGATDRLACGAAQNGSQFVYISTDSVFDGMRGGYREQDSPKPLNQYARSKAQGENVASQHCPDALIIRTNFFGSNQNGKPNIGKWMYERLVRAEPLPAFSDVRFNPLFVGDVAKIVLELISRNATGIFHVAARDSCTKYEFALLLCRTMQLDTSNLKPVLLEEVPFRAKRPRDTSLCVRKCEEFLGRKMPSVAEGTSKFAASLAATHYEQPGGQSERERMVALNAR